ncbi:MAG: dihydroorotase [Fidelibacterota bacterium]
MTGNKTLQVTSLPRHSLIRNAVILDPVSGTEFPGEIRLKNGRIVEVGEKVQTDGARELDMGGKIVTHGFCDIHAHFREPGREDKETLETGARAALAGGFTTVCVMPNTNPPLDRPESIRFVVEKSQDLPVRIHPIGAITVGLKGTELTEMGAMVREGAVAFSDDGVPVMDGGVMKRALEYARPLGVPLINHSEDLALKGDGQMNEGEWSTRLGMAGISDVSESVMVARDVQLAEYTGGRLHVPHLSSRKTLTWIEHARAVGAHVTAEVTPHHLTFNHSALESFNTDLKVAPPVRSEKDRQALIKALKEGTIDCIATDHAPHTVEEKESPFDWAPWGMIGLETAFGAAWKVLSAESVPLAELIRFLTVKPRTVMGFEPNLFQEGIRAELTVLDPDVEWSFSRDDIYSKSRNTPFVGETLKGRILTVISRGKLFSFAREANP